jgi:hypothetical protein
MADPPRRSTPPAKPTGLDLETPDTGRDEPAGVGASRIRPGHDRCRRWFAPCQITETAYRVFRPHDIQFGEQADGGTPTFSVGHAGETS